MAAASWRAGRSIDGVVSIDLPSWADYYNYIHDEMVKYAFVYRGQRDSSWKLEPSIDRMKSTVNRKRHLTLFKRATRGRRGPNPPTLKDDNDWWALGQHYGLATPLLDWTSSPFVAAFFAFVEPSDPDGGVSRRAVWALAMGDVMKRSAAIKKKHVGPGRPAMIEFIRPYSDENPRLINQGGLFTLAPDGVDIEAWIRQNFDGSTVWTLVKMTLPDNDRESCLRDLNAMNINPLTLFGDLEGAGRYCNLAGEVDKYEI